MTSDAVVLLVALFGLLLLALAASAGVGWFYWEAQKARTQAEEQRRFADLSPGDY